MTVKISCPLCGKETIAKSLNNWKFGRYAVTRYECGGCQSKFNVYKSANRSYTIPKIKNKIS